MRKAANACIRTGLRSAGPPAVAFRETTMKYIIGVDVGGTNTDAVVLSTSDRKVISWTKKETTANVTDGLLAALRTVLVESNIDAGNVVSVIIGTTHFINAVVQRKHLAKVAVVRLCGEATTALPPFSDWPLDLKEKVEGSVAILKGGFDTDGKEIHGVCEAEIRSACKEIVARGLLDVAVTGVFSPMNDEQEKLAERIIREEIPNARISLSSHIGRIGFLERENATILNAAVKPLASKTISELLSAVRGESGLQAASVFLTQNDGTILSASQAIDVPVCTFASGATNSMRGAAYLTGFGDAIVVDVGGTTTDIGMLSNHFPREKAVEVEIGGVKTNFRMPDVFSFGLGGGSMVTKFEDGSVRVGPQSVGYKLTSEAIVCGGNTLTSTDIAVSADLTKFGNHDAVNDLAQDTVEKALAEMRRMLEDNIDEVKTSTEPVPVVIVGGGGFLAPSELRGVEKVVRPENFPVANAIGAAMAQVAGIIDSCVSYESRTRDEVLQELEAEAKGKALTCGAVESTLSTVEMEEIPLAYLPGNFIRVRIRVVGDLDLENSSHLLAVSASNAEIPVYADSDCDKQADASSAQKSNHSQRHGIVELIAAYDKPKVTSDGFWELSHVDIEFITMGAAFLGAGGGGSPYHSKLRAQSAIARGMKMRVAPIAYLADNDYVAFPAALGAPTAMIEKLPSGHECTRAFHGLQQHMESQGTNKKLAAIMPVEIGGLNSVEPLLTAAMLELPVLDGDLMGRAFPEVQMVTLYMYGLPCWPSAIADQEGRLEIFDQELAPKEMEDRMRGFAIRAGCVSGVALSPMTKTDLKSYAIFNTMSQAWSIGKIIFAARTKKVDPLQAVAKRWGGRVLFAGKIAALERWTESGFSRGKAVIESTGSGGSVNRLLVDFQNENLIAWLEENGKRTMVACVPDIIQLAATDDGRPITTEELRFGSRVTAVVLPAPPVLRSDRALAVCGPKAFGYDVTYVPCGDWVVPQFAPEMTD